VEGEEKLKELLLLFFLPLDPAVFFEERLRRRVLMIYITAQK
jgi:hypothetical protein